MLRSRVSDTLGKDTSSVDILLFLFTSEHDELELEESVPVQLEDELELELLLELFSLRPLFAGSLTGDGIT